MRRLILGTSLFMGALFLMGCKEEKYTLECGEGNNLFVVEASKDEITSVTFKANGQDLSNETSGVVKEGWVQMKSKQSMKDYLTDVKTGFESTSGLVCKITG